MEKLIDLPRLPMTEQYEPWTETFKDHGYVDQAFLYCEACSHGKLETIVPADALYGASYRTASAKSIGSIWAISKFATFIKDRIPESQYDCVIDIGGNDGLLLAHFPDKRRVSVDPNASGDVELIREYIEDADLAHLKPINKLVCCSHTLEHIERPEDIFRKLREIVMVNDYCAFQFPSLNYLVQDCRIDQIHHQHIHYYSQRSISLLLTQYGFEIMKFEFDPSHYGTIMLIFRRGNAGATSVPIGAAAIEDANSLFRSEMTVLDDRIARSYWLIGYGASLMLPLLKYYLPSLKSLAYVVDEDESKHGQRYTNFNVPIKPVHNMAGRDVVITAFNTKRAVRKIAEKLFAQDARNVIVPFHYL